MAPALSTQETRLKCQTWVLKVFIHCEDCVREVKKALQRIEGVYTTTIEAEQNKVTVIGNIQVQSLMNELFSKTGKRAELWPENLTRKEKRKPVKAKNNDKQKSSGTTQSRQTTTCDKAGVPYVLNGSDITAAPPAQASMTLAPCYCYGHHSVQHSLTVRKLSVMKMLMAVSSCDCNL